MKKNFFCRTREIFFGLLTVLFLSGPGLAAGVSVSAQRTEIIEKAKSDLNGVKEKLNQKMTGQQRAGDAAGARNTRLRIQAANSLSNMLEADSGTGGDIYKVNLIEQYAFILNIQDFSGFSVREIMNYRMPSPNEMYDGSDINGARIRTGSKQKDGMALEALEGRALTYASHNTYETMHNGYLRGMGNVAIALNDTFADINPGTAFLEAGLGIKVSGEDIGREMSAGERAMSVGKGVAEVVVDVKADQYMKDTAKSLGTKVGGGKTSKAPAGKSNGADAGEAPSLKGAADDADNTITKINPAAPQAGEKVIGKVDLASESGEDLAPLLELENFNIDLRTGEVTAGGSFTPKDQGAIEEAFNGPSASGGTAATAAVPAPGGGTGTEKIVGVIDLNDVNNTLDVAGLTGLDNFNIDLRTGEITVSDAPGGRLSFGEQEKIAEGLKSKGPIGHDTKVDVGFSGRETEIAPQNDTTIMEGNIWGGTYRDRPKPAQDGKGRKPRTPKSPWDIFDFMEPGRSPESGTPKPAGLDVVIFGPQGQPVNGSWDIFVPGFENGILPETGKPEEPQGADIPGEEDDDDPCWGADCIEFGRGQQDGKDIGRETGFSSPGESSAPQGEAQHPDHGDHFDFPN